MNERQEIGTASEQPDCFGEERSDYASPLARAKEDEQWEWERRAPREFRGRVRRLGSFWLERLDIANNDMGKNGIQLKGDSEVMMLAREFEDCESRVSLVDCHHGHGKR